jgi:hypothetical protein
MIGKVTESLVSEIAVLLFDKTANRVIFQENGRNACIEIEWDS